MQFTMNDKVWSSAADGGGGNRGSLPRAPYVRGAPTVMNSFK